MSILRYRPKNHPQQVLFRGRDIDADERATPAEYFAQLHERFRFTVDAAALPYNAKLDRYWTPAEDGLEQPWKGERVWCNPPFSNIEPWLAKAARVSALGKYGAELVVMLLPANRTDLGWWHEHIEPHRDNGSRLHVEFLPGRIRFGIGRAAPLPGTRPPFGCCLVIWGDDYPRNTIERSTP